MAQRKYEDQSYTLNYVLQDHLGSTAATYDTSTSSTTTISYFSFGATRSTSGALPTDKKFTGQRLDQTGLYYYNARYYDAEIGRFISPDTIVPNFANPQSLNRYSYCLNNPLRYVDPSGHSEQNPETPEEYEAYIKLWHRHSNRGRSESGGGSNGSWSYESLAKELSRYNYANFPIFRKSAEEILDELQTTLDIVGLIPGIGEPADAINALIYLGRGDLVAAAFSIGAIIPVAGVASTGLKWGYKAGTKLLNPPIGITAKGWNHVLNNHILPKLNKSTFSLNVDVMQLIKDATQAPIIKQSKGNDIRIIDAGKLIRYDHTKKQLTSVYTVITHNGELVTAFPGLPK